MIAWLQGQLLVKKPPFIMLNVNGVGYELEAPMTVFYDLPAVNETVALYCHMVVREDAQLLFAFTTEQQRDFFRSLVKVNGVGPKVALAILSTMTPAELVQCILDENISQLTKVPGIGTKTAQRLVVEMKDRVEKSFGDLASQDQTIASDHRQDAIEALTALGYKAGDASRVVRGLDNDLSSEELIRQSLRHLSGNVL